ncbi:MAG: hypothetical protein KBA50_06720, partial [Sedimentibacter sp.]|nr:hypothetical protein [Sedimentibacter sp.]
MRNSADINKVCPVIKGQLSSSSNISIPVIISYKSSKKIKEGEISSLSSKLKHSLPIINGCACEMNIDSILRLTSDPDVEFISYDSKVFVVMEEARKTIGADYS